MDNVCKWYLGIKERKKTPKMLINALRRVLVPWYSSSVLTLVIVTLQRRSQLLSSLAVASLADDDADDDDDFLSDDGKGPSVQRQSLVRFRRPAMGVSGQESLSSSDEDESRFSPVRGPLCRGELSAELGFSSDSCRGDMLALDELLDVLTSSEWCEADVSEAVVAVDEATDEMVDRVEMDDSRYEWAMVYLVVVISSSSGVRKHTCFSTGNMGRLDDMLRGMMERAGLFLRTEVRLWGCL